ncbi:hypothetical protein SDJN02_05687, partial [Cucurbita argyrosperma subsp. argyrosperma]
MSSFCTSRPGISDETRLRRVRKVAKFSSTFRAMVQTYGQLKSSDRLTEDINDGSFDNVL